MGFILNPYRFGGPVAGWIASRDGDVGLSLASSSGTDSCSTGAPTWTGDGYSHTVARSNYISTHEGDFPITLSNADSGIRMLVGTIDRQTANHSTAGISGNVAAMLDSTGRWQIEVMFNFDGDIGTYGGIRVGLLDTTGPTFYDMGYQAIVATDFWTTRDESFFVEWYGTTLRSGYAFPEENVRSITSVPSLPSGLTWDRFLIIGRGGAGSATCGNNCTIETSSVTVTPL